MPANIPQVTQPQLTNEALPGDIDRFARHLLRSMPEGHLLEELVIPLKVVRGEINEARVLLRSGRVCKITRHIVPLPKRKAA